VDRDRGAHFHRSDFQVHTPRDGAWKGKKARTADERTTYAKDFVAECRRIGLNAVAITDHHDLLFAPIIRKAAAEEVDENGDLLPEWQRLVVFPGVELTLALGRQALLILDADFPDDRLVQVLQALAITPVDEAESTLPAVKSLDHITSFSELHKKLDEHEWMQGRYIVLPNATDRGHKSIMRKGMQTEYKDMPCVGGYLDGSIDKIGTGVQKIVAGEDSAWGNKAIALFQTSDSRTADFSTLGVPSTWVKWAQPTAEALRQACLGHQSRIAHQVPELPSVVLSRMMVSNSKFLGPVDVAFNAQYNAIIGGRGTGKSTILEYLRWGLCDQAAQAGDDELANPTVRRERLIENTLKPVGGQVEVYFSINEIPHVVRRDAATGEILLKVGTEEFAKVREEHVRSLLPIHAYSQKQLSSVALRVDELMRFVTAPIQRALDTLDQKITEVSGRLRENYAKVQRARDLDTAIERQRLAEKSLAEQAANLRKSLSDLSEDDRRVLDSKPAYDSVREALDSQERDIADLLVVGDEFLTRVSAVREHISATQAAPNGLDELVGALRAARERALDQLHSAISTAVSEMRRVREAGNEAHDLSQAAYKAIADFEVLYGEVKGRSTAHQAKLGELSEVEQRRTDASELLSRHQRDRKGLGDPIGTHADLRAELVALLRERTRLLTEETERLTSLSGGLLRTSINRGHGLAAVEQKFKGFIQGSGVRGGRVEQLFAALHSESDPLETWEEVLSELETIMQFEEDVEHTSETTPALSRLGFPLPDQQRIRSRITADGWLDLALTPIKDEPAFEYQTKEHEFIAFNAASAGQQATALLRVLLSQTGMPLIIDQPEEDLDSQVVQDVVAQIWEAKKGRQLIFASHNANLVVNGDAELVVACDYRKQGDQSGGQVKLEGAIDVPAVREEITRVMEGGEKAFRLRKERYGF
jgi:chromosome segregation protein